MKSRLRRELRAFPIAEPEAARASPGEPLGRPFFKEKNARFFQYFPVGSRRRAVLECPVKALTGDERRWTRSGMAFCPVRWRTVRASYFWHDYGRNLAICQQRKQVMPQLDRDSPRRTQRQQRNTRQDRQDFQDYPEHPVILSKSSSLFRHV